VQQALCGTVRQNGLRLFTQSAAKFLIPIPALQTTKTSSEHALNLRLAVCLPISRILLALSLNALALGVVLKQTAPAKGRKFGNRSGVL
jgi:hypothetical protein